ncbi:hypothetical protein Y032_0101g3368 [Ancylostoma ceylanicum]|nr:hypothetical protein Y032_0101g3368 [Ancylostoma ceylanicum]
MAQNNQGVIWITVCYIYITIERWVGTGSTQASGLNFHAYPVGTRTLFRLSEDTTSLVLEHRIAGHK